MPIYLYQYINPDGSLGEPVELMHASTLEPLTHHPETKKPIVKRFTAPNLGLKHTPGQTQKRLNDEHLQKNGFQKYQRRKGGGYDKVV